MSTCCNPWRWGGLAAVAIGAFTALAIAMGAQPQTPDTKKAELNKAAPTFTLTDQNGEEVSLDDHDGKIVVLEWFNSDCPYVKRWYQDGRMTQLARKHAGQDIVWLAINPTPGHDQEHNKKIAEEWEIDYPILTDADTKVSKTYGARTTPHMFIIDKEGTLVYDGAIDDDPRGDKGEEANNYVDKAIDELLAGDSVSQQETKPYGCAVKYLN